MDRIIAVFLGFLVSYLFLKGIILSEHLQGFVTDTINVLFSIMANICVVGFGLVIIFHAFKNSKIIFRELRKPNNSDNQNLN
ncbi:MAG: hypothetical protein ABRQ24_06280 [Syntrophomonadaceae bacterium]